MKTDKIEKLIIKYLAKSISKKEWNELNKWFEKCDDTKVFDEYLKINYAIDDIMSEFNTEGTKNSILKKIKRDKKWAYTSKAINVLKYAAVAFVLLGTGYFYKQEASKWNGKNITSPHKEVITLELENGSLEALLEDEASQIIDADGKVIGKQSGSRLIYNKVEDDQEVQELVYNQLTVPYGKRFELELSDGTIVHLNAGSSLKYPVSFIKGQQRSIFLVGEAFFDVAKDKEHPFVVYTAEDLNIQVLGTQFNVSNYPEDKMTEVVLVEGSVGLIVDNRTNDVILEPGFKGSFDRDEKSIITKQVITNMYTSWMNGELVFRDMTFESILKKLERHYNVVILDQNLKFSQKKFNANFGDEPIKNILNYFKNTYGINYKISDNRVILK